MTKVELQRDASEKRQENESNHASQRRASADLLNQEKKEEAEF